MDIANAGTAAAEAINGADIDTPATPTANKNTWPPVTGAERVPLIRSSKRSMWQARRCG
jgi:hypothetical protein